MAPNYASGKPIGIRSLHFARRFSDVHLGCRAEQGGSPCLSDLAGRQFAVHASRLRIVGHVMVARDGTVLDGV